MMNVNSKHKRTGMVAVISGEKKKNFNKGELSKVKR